MSIAGSYIVSYLGGNNLVGVEIGVWYGRSLISTLRETRIKKMYGVDPYVPYPMSVNDRWGVKEWDECYEQVQRNLRPFGSKVTLIRKRAEDAVGLIPDGVDFVFNDGNHSYESTWKNIELYEPKVKKGGMMCGHDYGGEHFEEVTRAVDDYAAKYGRSFHPKARGVRGWWCWMV